MLATLDFQDNGAGVENTQLGMLDGNWIELPEWNSYPNGLLRVLNVSVGIDSWAVVSDEILSSGEGPVEVNCRLADWIESLIGRYFEEVPEANHR